MSWLQNVFNLIKQKIWHNQKGNANLFFLAVATIINDVHILLRCCIKYPDEDKERIAHFYNAYQMAQSVQGQFVNTFLLKGVSDATFKDEDGNSTIYKKEFERLIKMDNGAIFTLTNLF